MLIVGSMSVAAVQEATENSDAGEMTAVVDAFHAALSAGDRSAALACLAPELIVLENGHIETADEYIEHHLPLDMEFSRSVPSRRRIINATFRADTGWVISAWEHTGEFRGQPVNSTGAELMILRKDNGAWKIAAIHWSSKNRK